MNELSLLPLEYNGEKVLTTAMLAEAYERCEKTIHRNFERNRKYFQEERHFYELAGEELRKFVSDNLSPANNFSKIRKIHLWTKRGTLLHAKSLNTEKAWDVYEYLVEHYFNSISPKKLDSYMIDDPIKRAERWIEEERERQALRVTVDVQKRQIQEMKPQAEFCTNVLAYPDAISTMEIAKDYGRSAQWLNQYLRKKGVQYKQGNIWLLYQKYAGQGYTTTRTHICNGNNGQRHCKVHTYWTQKGRWFIYNLLKKDGILPVVERQRKDSDEEIQDLPF